MTAALDVSLPATPVDRARRGLILYFALVVAGSAACEAVMIRAGRPIEQQMGMLTLLMWTPGLASLACRAALREGVRDVSFELRGKRGLTMLALGWLLPLAVGLVAYGAAWCTGLETFAAPEQGLLLAHAPAAIQFAANIGLNLSLGVVFSALSSSGEEIGWRGYMLTRLIDAGVPRPVLVSGVVWALWHVPLIVSGLYAAGPHPVLSAMLFGPNVVAAGYLAARLRLESGSVWPAVAFHASWNALIQGSFDAFTRGGGASHTTSIWIGESGILVVAVNIALVALLVWRPWPVRRSPGGEARMSLSARTA
jgi:membrane protease YdiL (CAAX protease family)